MSTGPKMGQPRALGRPGETKRDPRGARAVARMGLENALGRRVGRPRGVWSERSMRELERKTREWARETGKHPWDILLELMHRAERDDTRLAAVKLWAELSAGKYTRHEVDVRQVPPEPAIYLPEMRPDPAKLVPLPTRPVGT